MYYTYILTNKVKTVLYVGFTDDLCSRLIRYKESINSNRQSFDAKYNTHYLLYFEEYIWVQDALNREKELKKWRREKKIALIQTKNPDFNFLNHLFEASPKLEAKKLN